MRGETILGGPCQKCGSTVRYKRTWQCVSCARQYANDRSAEFRRKNPNYQKEYRKRFFVHGLLAKALKRAEARGVEFAIGAEHVRIPEVCPVLGIPLVIGHPDRGYWPSLDCIVPKFGYVPGNIQVISYRANRIKNDGTAEEHEKIAAWIREQDNSHLLD